MSSKAASGGSTQEVKGTALGMSVGICRVKLTMKIRPTVMEPSSGEVIM